MIISVDAVLINIFKITTILRLTYIWYLILDRISDSTIVVTCKVDYSPILLNYIICLTSIKLKSLLS